MARNDFLTYYITLITSFSLVACLGIEILFELLLSASS
jgi:hypothetical protein